MPPICWMLWPRPVCVAQLGKYGDLMILLPAFKAIFDATAIKPVVIVAQQFASILEGVSYVSPLVVDMNWWADLFKAKALGEQRFGHCITPKFWDCPGLKAPMQLNGDPELKGWNQSYQTSQWCYAGFTMRQFWEWPLVFDRRDAQREEVLRKATFKTDKPKLLVNLNAGGTSPFPCIKLVNDTIREMGRFEVVDLQTVKAHRIYDLLGLYDSAAGLVTSDTATLHLTGASSVPYLAFVNNDGMGSVPKGNCIGSLRYSQASQSKAKITETISKFLF